LKEALKFLANNLLILLITLIGSGFGVYLAIDKNNSNVEEQDIKAAIRLLRITSEETADQAKALENMVAGSDSKNLDSTDSLGNFIELKNSLKQFEYSGINLPYPVVFDKVVEDSRVYSRLSSTGIRSIYRIQESLKEEKSYILGLNKGTQDFLIANKEYPLFVFKDQDEIEAFVDSYVRVSNLEQYKKHLEVLSSILKIQANYIEGNITEEKTDIDTRKVEEEAFKPGSTELEQEIRLRKMKQIENFLRQLESESAIADLTQKYISK